MSHSDASHAWQSEEQPGCLELLLTRRSTRRFSAEPVCAGQVEALLRAAMAAPSAGDERPWTFVVIDDPRVMRATASDRGMEMLASAPAAILVCADPRVAKYRGFWLQDCAAATQNILLAAHCLGLGATWMGIYPIGYRTRRVRRVLGLPRRIVPVSLVAVGRALGPPSVAPDRYDTVRQHRNQWSAQRDRETRLSLTQSAVLLAKRYLRYWLRR